MASTAVSEMIFFIAAIIVSSAVALTLVEVIDTYAENIGDNASLVEAEMRAKVTIINDPLYVIYDTSDTNLTFYLKNTGTMDLSIPDIVVSANGTSRGGDDIWVDLMGNGTRWRPGDVVEVTFRVPKLKEGMDYSGWASTSGLSERGTAKGSADYRIIFRVKEV
jgi:archaellum component FlaG (FlaF/FlaG flagellin family)